MRTKLSLRAATLECSYIASCLKTWHLRAILFGAAGTFGVGQSIEV